MKIIPVYFFKEGVRFRLMKKKLLPAWIAKMAKHEKCTLVNVNFIFCGDRYLRKINKEYLDHDYNTDIVTFNNSTSKNKIEGDIFISIDTVESNSVKYGFSFHDELNRVMAHGVLHLLGYDDKTNSGKKTMRKMEDFWLKKRTF